MGSVGGSNSRRSTGSAPEQWGQRDTPESACVVAIAPDRVREKRGDLPLVADGRQTLNTVVRAVGSACGRFGPDSSSNTVAVGALCPTATLTLVNITLGCASEVPVTGSHGRAPRVLATHPGSRGTAVVLKGILFTRCYPRCGVVFMMRDDDYFRHAERGKHIPTASCDEHRRTIRRVRQPCANCFAWLPLNPEKHLRKREVDVSDLTHIRVHLGISTQSSFLHDGTSSSGCTKHTTPHEHHSSKRAVAHSREKIQHPTHKAAPHHNERNDKNKTSSSVRVLSRQRRAGIIP